MRKHRIRALAQKFAHLFMVGLDLREEFLCESADDLAFNHGAEVYEAYRMMISTVNQGRL